MNKFLQLLVFVALVFLVLNLVFFFGIQVNDICQWSPNSDCPPERIHGGHIEGIFVGITAIATAFIALFTWKLRDSTEKLFTETKKSADAAKASADALPAIERAYVFVDRCYFTTQDGKPVVRMVFKNLGRTPALIREIKWQFIPAGQPLPATPEYPIALWPKYYFMLDAQNDPQYPGWTAPDISIPAGKQRWFHGVISYEDIFKNPRTTRFCYMENPFGGDPFIRSENEAFTGYD